MRHLRPSDYIVMPWKNGGGATTELAREPNDGDDPFLWRISIATVDRAGPFSKFEGYERIITLLSGAGMTLDFGAAHPPVRLDKRLLPFRFSGDWQTDCHLLGGTVTDFNVMAARGKSAARVEAIECGTEGTSAAVTGEYAFLYVVEGRAACEVSSHTAIALAAGEALLWQRSTKDEGLFTLKGKTAATALVIDLALMPQPAVRMSRQEP